MEKRPCPSMMCADLGGLKGEVSRLEEAGAQAGVAISPAQRGGKGFALGTSILFGKGRPYAGIMPGLRAL